MLPAGSAEPSKYRAPSAVLLQLCTALRPLPAPAARPLQAGTQWAAAAQQPACGFLLMDCGEGTWGQLVRAYGAEGAAHVVGAPCACLAASGLPPLAAFPAHPNALSPAHPCKPTPMLSPPPTPMLSPPPIPASPPHQNWPRFPGCPPISPVPCPPLPPARPQAANLPAVWLSHKHADHMLGLPGLLAARPASAPPLLVVGPAEAGAWLAATGGHHPGWRYEFVHCR